MRKNLKSLANKYYSDITKKFLNKNMKKKPNITCNSKFKGIADGVNRIQPSLGLMLNIEKNGHQVKIYDAALDGGIKENY